MLVPVLMSVVPTTIKADACIILLEDFVVRWQPFQPSSLVPHFSLRRLSTIPNLTLHHQTEKPLPQFVRKVLAAARDLCKGNAASEVFKLPAYVEQLNQRGHMVRPGAQRP